MAVFNVHSFLTFRNVAVPASIPGRNVIIHKAVITFTANDNFFGSGPNTNEQMDAIIDAHCSPNSDNPTVGNEPDNWDLTATIVDWIDVGPWTHNTEYETPNIACVVQEVVRLEGWQSGNTMTIFVRNHVSAANAAESEKYRESWDYVDLTEIDPDKQAKLDIWWSYEYTEEGTDGIEFGGSAEVYGSYNDFPEGGIEFGGAALFGENYVNVPEGGIEFGGSVTELVQVTVEGGIEFGGTHSLGTTITPVGGIVFGPASFANGYLCRIKVTVPAHKLSASFDKFYLGLKLPTQCVLTGEDFQVEKDSVVLPHELRKYDGSDVWLFVKTDLSNETDNIFYVYAGRE